MKNLQLSLKGKWFEMTDINNKSEDYREITPYWIKRLTHYNKDSYQGFDLAEAVIFLKNQTHIQFRLAHSWIPDFCFPKKFNTNTMTLGYPKATDTSRIKIFEHKGIEIGYGKEEWGAEPNKLYFIIKHGKRLQ